METAPLVIREKKHEYHNHDYFGHCNSRDRRGGFLVLSKAPYGTTARSLRSGVRSGNRRVREPAEGRIRAGTAREAGRPFSDSRPLAGATRAVRRGLEGRSVEICRRASTGPPAGSRT